MGFVKVSQLKEHNKNIGSDSYFYIVQDNKSYKIKFSNLQNVFKSSISLGSINPSTNVSDLPNGVYSAEKSGVYDNIGGLEAKQSYLTFFRKKGSNWSIESETKISVVDLNFDPNSENAQSGKAVNEALLNANIGFGGEILDLNQLPNAQGMYIPKISGVYPNFGNLEHNPIEGLTLFLYKDNIFSKIIIPLNGVEDKIEYNNNILGVSGSAVYNFTTQKVENIASLRVLEGQEDGQIIELLGYYEKGDKNSLKYMWSHVQGIDDGGYIINSLNGSWKAIFDDYVFIEDFGVSEFNDTNSNSIKKAIDLGLKIKCLPNKKYKILNTITTSKNVNIDFDDSTIIYSLPKIDNGIVPMKILEITDSKNVIIKGVFDGGYKYDGTTSGSPISSLNVSSLIDIRKCNLVNLINLKIQNYATNWLSVQTLDVYMSHSALYVRDCEDVTLTKGFLTTSRIEGFSFIGNKNVKIDSFVSKDNIGVWTPMHCFLNKNVDIKNIDIQQNSNSLGSSLNLYNTSTRVDNCRIENGAGIDFSFELNIDISSFNITPNFIQISNNTLVNTDRIFYALHHSAEAVKSNVNVFNNNHEFTDKVSSGSLSSLIRIDNAENVNVYNNSNKNSFEYLSFFQTTGMLKNCKIYDNKTYTDNFARITQNVGREINGIKIYDNNAKIMPLNDRASNNSFAFSSMVYIAKSTNELDVIKNIKILNNNSDAEGRVTFVNNTIDGCENIHIEGNKHNSNQQCDVNILINKCKNIKVIDNTSDSSILFSNMTNVAGKLEIRGNNELSIVNKTRAMFQTLSGNVSELILKDNMITAPNANTFGLVNTDSNLIVAKRTSENNMPNVSSARVNCANTKYGITANRPTNLVNIGHEYFDTNISKPIYFNGTNWVDSQGVVI